ncbi:MAG: hypothetical protein HY318_12545 [Armatimonadetes bacterium]|nr:hypothetical protein [Armatimonadota bacterium]
MMKLTDHRILFTGDCTYLFMDAHVNNPEGGRYTAKVFHDHVDLLADSGVDTVLVNATEQHAWYPSRKFPKVYQDYRRGDREFFRGHIPCTFREPEKIPAVVDAWLDEQVEFMNRFLDLEEAGVDWVAEMAKACRRRKVSPWLTFRMNDIHGSGNRQGSYMNCPLFRNLRYCLSGESLNPRDGVSMYWQALNYEKEEVREYMFTPIRELVEEYDYEGLELDWWRNPFCCEPNASQKTIDTITDWVAQIRALTEAKSRKTGKPYALGLRIPGTLGLLRSIGLDVVAMARKGLIDFVSPSNFWQTSWDMPHDRLRELLGDQVTIFGVIEDAPNWLLGYSPILNHSGPRMLSASAPLLRGNAAGKLVLGADGIEFFNFFCTDSDPMFEGKVTRVSRTRAADYGSICGIGDLESLRGKPKHYTLSKMAGGNWYPPYELPEQLPAILEPQWRRAFRLPMCAEPTDRELNLVIQVVVERTETPPDIGVSFNGSWPNYDAQPTDELVFPTGPFTHHVAEHQASNFHFRADQIVEGWNEIVVYNNRLFFDSITTGRRPDPRQRRELAFCIVSIELAVK